MYWKVSTQTLVMKACIGFHLQSFIYNARYTVQSQCNYTDHNTLWFEEQETARELLIGGISEYVVKDAGFYWREAL